MKLSVRGEYALRALTSLSLDYKPNSVLRIQAISEEQNIPKRFLEQILNDLRSAGILESKRGIAGGYRLKVPPEQVSLAQVIRHIEGPLAPVNCVSERFYEKCTCPDEAKCALRSVMKEVRDSIVKILEGVTLAQLAERVRELRKQPENPLDFII